MKIMIVAPYFLPKIGGLENYVLGLAKGMRDLYGHEVFIVTSNHEKKQKDEITIEGLKIIRLPILFKLSNTPINPLWYFQLRKIIAREKPQLINAHSPVPFMADMSILAAGKGTPTLLTYHAGSMLKGTGGLVDKALGAYEGHVLPWLCKRADKIAAVHPTFISTKTKDNSKVLPMPPGIDTATFKPLKIPKTVDILSVGRIERSSSWKGLDILLKAVAICATHNPDIKLKIVGDGDAVSDHKKLVRQLGIQKNVMFAGRLQGKKLTEAYNAARIFALPSKTDSEAFGMVAAEAMACGTPVIASNIGGIVSIVKDGKNGIPVTPSDPEILSRAIMRLLNEPKLLKQMGKNGEKFIKKQYGLKKLLSNYEATIQEIVRPKVCIIHNIISPYRLPIFEELSKSVNLTVLFCRPITQDRRWSFDLNAYSFKHEILRGFRLGPVLFNTNSLKQIRKTKFDVIVASNDPDIAPAALTGLVLAKLRRKKYVSWSQVITDRAYSLAKNQILQRPVSSYRNIHIRQADSFYAISNAAADFLISKSVDPSKIKTSINVMPGELLSPPTSRSKRTGKTFLYMGYLNERKGVDYLIKAFRGLSDPEAKLIIAGSGAQEAFLKSLAKNDARINFTGYVEDTVKANIYRSADVLILPTLHDSWGLVVNEAMNYGLAVITTNAAAAKEIVNEDAGIIVGPKNSHELKSAMDYFLQNPARLRKIQRNNRGRTDITDISIMADKLGQAIGGEYLHA